MDNTLRKHYLIMRRTVGFICLLMFPVCQIFIKLFCKPGVNFYDCDPFMAWRNISTMAYSNVWMVACGCLSVMVFAFMTFPGYDKLDNVFYKITSGTLLLNILCTNNELAIENPNTVIQFRGFFPIDPQISTIIHIVTGTITFIMLGLTCFWLFPKGQGEKTERKAIRNIIYKVSGIMCFCAILVCTCGVSGTLRPDIEILYKISHWKWTAPISEYIIFCPVGISWLIKGEAISILNDK